MKKNRILICLSGGVISACLCQTGSQILFGFPVITWSTVSMTIANRMLLGLVIGISSLRVKGHLHGALLGLILSLTVSIGFLPGEILKIFSLHGSGNLLWVLY